MKLPPFLLTACLAGLLLPLVTMHLAAYPAGMIVWLIDLASHWQWLFLLGLVYSCMIAMRKNIRWGIVLLALPLPWLTATQPAPSAGMGSPSPEKILSIATANVHLDNRSAKALGQWTDQASPDVVVLNEVSPAYALIDKGSASIFQLTALERNRTGTITSIRVRNGRLSAIESR
jgi:endonuclease/exonuclease/phosphatase (EEP) superfamily protein YafD